MKITTNWIAELKKPINISFLVWVDFLWIFFFLFLSEIGNQKKTQFKILESKQDKLRVSYLYQNIVELLGWSHHIGLFDLPAEGVITVCSPWSNHTWRAHSQ